MGYGLHVMSEYLLWHTNNCRVSKIIVMIKL